MRLDSLPKPDTLWYEDKNGDKLDVDISHGHPDFPKDTEWYQHHEWACVRYSVCTRSSKPKWPVRILSWLIKRMPDKWQGNSSQIGSGETTINCMYPVIKYLVEQRDWSFNLACVASSRLCSRCMNICLWECEGHDLSSEQHYLDTTKTVCQYCKYIDPEHLNKYRVWCCYRTLKLGGDIAQAYKNMSVYSAPGVF